VKARALVLLALVAALLSGCGAVVRVAYNNADYALRVAAHDWFDLHGEQSDQMRARIEAFHAWHRVHELPAYARLFYDAADRVERGLKREDVVWALEGVRVRYRALAEHAVGDATPVIATFTPANYAAFERKLSEDNDKFVKDVLKADPARRERNRTKAIAGRFEEWLGSLTAEQEELVRRFARGGAAVLPAMMEDRVRRQKELVRLMETYRTSPELRDRLTAYLVDIERGRGAAYAKLAQAREADFIQLVLDMDRTLTPRQRAYAVAKLRRYADEFTVLAGQGRRDAAAAARSAVPQPAGAGG
jgi:hypothetical protein